MKSNLRNLASRLLAVFMVVGLCVSAISCTDTENTDSTKFAIHYAGITDIGPSMNFTLSAPTYLGGTPSGFTITRVTLDGETYETNCFTIDNESTGSIKIENTENLPTGTYSISIGCYSNGEYYEFPDAISINMLAAVPDGITVSPEVVAVDLADIYSDEASAQVSTEEDSHVHITKYEIVQEEGKEYFAISKTGKITVNSSYKGEIPPAKYVLNLKLTTGAGTGIYADAVTFNITSSPLTLNYSPNSVRVEENVAYTSNAPTLKGSIDGLTYSIKSVTPSTDAITIDPATGVLSLKENNGLAIGSAYNVGVTVKNDYGTKDFDDVFVFNIVAYINPITTLVYDNQETIQGVAFEYTPATVDGDELTYTLESVDAALDGKISIDAVTGAVSAKKGNTIPLGTHNITVKVSNTKSEHTATFTLTITPNPYLFTYVHWGNNLGLTPARNYASQYRFTKKADIDGFTIELAESDIPEGQKVNWKIEKTSLDVKPTIKDGTITLSLGNKTWQANKVYYILVSATTGKGTAGETTVKTPVFIHCQAAVKDVTVEYTPFVFQVNPQKGGTSVTPTISGVDSGLFLMDYRRTFNYYNINGPEEHVDGQPSNASSFMNRVWKTYWDSVGKSNNTGSRAPLSFIDNTNLSLPLGYVDEANGHCVKINPNKWTDENGYANGVFIAQMTFTTDGKSANVVTGSQIFPIAIWFDENF